MAGFSLPSVDICRILSIHLQSIRPHLNNESLIIIQKLIQGWRATRWLNAKSEGFLRLAIHGGCDRTCHGKNEMSLAIFYWLRTHSMNSYPLNGPEVISV